MPHRIQFNFILIPLVLMTACQPLYSSALTATLLPTAAVTDWPLPVPTSSPTHEPSITPTRVDTETPTMTLQPTTVPTPTVTPLAGSLNLEAADWHNWPVVPIVTKRARAVYLLGQALGNDPHAFSVLGDCQDEPQVFMGTFETDPLILAALPVDMQMTVDWFKGSFNRQSPTVRGGTTTGALLWSQWHENRFTCTSNESPLQCELRIHKPSFVIIQVGSHYENRNESYMRSILDQLIAAGVVPILASKADDRELDEHVNSQYAQLAIEYNIPFWNFWASLSGLVNRGLYTRPDVPYQGDLYFTEEAAAIHRMSALQALGVVWQAVTGGN